MPPTLSIVTPSLNQARYLPECLRSVREQGVRIAEGGEDRDVEHLVVDGGSTDGSADIIASAPGLAWSVSEPDCGQSDAINKGLARARGEWATWLNADDWLEPGALPAMLGALRADPGIDVLVGRCRFVDLEGRTIFDPRPPQPITLANLLKLRSQWFNGRLIVQPEAFFRLSLFRDLGGLDLDNHYTMDHELWLKLLRAGARFKAVDVPVACMRAHPEQKTADNTRIVRCMLQFARPIYEAASAEGLLGDPAAAGGAGDELDAMQRKLADADLIAACWDAFERQRAAPAGASTDDDLEARWPWRTLPGEALELAAPHARAALRHAPTEGDITVLDPSGGGVLNRLAPQLVEPPRCLLRRPQRSLHTVSNLAGLQSLAPESIDGAITCCALAQLDDPGAALEILWGALRPGAPLLLLAETIVCPDLPAYLAHLRALMSVQLSQNHDTLISPEAAPWISRLREWHAGDARAPGSWARAHPSAQGVDLSAAADAIGAHVELARHYGGLWYHPLAPFPEVERDTGSATDSWAVAVWRKPKGP
jgi:GT2 family glycosyltransferase